MTLEEVLKRKQDLENEIKKMLNDFIIETGLRPDEVELAHGFALIGSEQGHLDGVIDVEIVVRL